MSNPDKTPLPKLTDMYADMEQRAHKAEAEVVRLRQEQTMYEDTLARIRRSVEREKERAVDAEAVVERLREALRRKCILDSYGITIENLTDDFDRWLEIVSSNEELVEWSGEPLPDYVCIYSAG